MPTVIDVAAILNQGVAPLTHSCRLVSINMIADRCGDCTVLVQLRHYIDIHQHSMTAATHDKHVTKLDSI